MQHRNIWLAGGAVIVLLIIGIFYFLQTPKATAPTTGSNATSTAMSTAGGEGTTTVDLGNGVTATLPPGVKITPVPSGTGGSSVPEPNLDYQVKFTAPGLTDQVKSTLATQIATWQSDLKKDPTNGDAWLELAVDYKIAGDFSAAESVWVYMTKVAPTSPVAFADLGDLYQNFLKNYPKAETNYLAALRLDPKNIDLYSNLYTLYRYQMNEPAKASAIVQQGLAVNPNNPTLLSLQKQQ